VSGDVEVDADPLIDVSVHLVGAIEVRVVGSAIGALRWGLEWDKACRLPLSMCPIVAGGVLLRRRKSIALWRRFVGGQDEATLLKAMVARSDRVR
jgi:hypothetical protein